MNWRIVAGFLVHQLLSICLHGIYFVLILIPLNIWKLNKLGVVLSALLGYVLPIVWCIGIPWFVGMRYPTALTGGRWAFVLPSTLFCLWFIDYSGRFGIDTTFQYAIGRPNSTEGLYLLFYTMPMLASICYSIGIELARRRLWAKKAMDAHIVSPE